MTRKYTREKNNLIMFIVITLFMFIASVAFYIYEKETTHIVESEKIKLKTEVELLGEFLHNSILRHDYAQAKNYLQSWIKQQKNIRNLEVTFDNGNSLFTYTMNSKEHISLKQMFKAGEKSYFINMSHSTTELEAHIRELGVSLLFLVVIFTSLVAFALWFILSRWILNPLQEEINDKTKDLSQKQKQLRQINRSYQALSECNIALLEAEVEQELLDNVCNIIHDKVGYKLVCIGYKLDDDAKNVKVMAYKGDSKDYLKNLEITWSNCEKGNGPIGKSIREHKAIIVNDTQSDPYFEPWRKNAKEKGFISIASIPVAIGSTVLGAIAIYSEKKDIFLNEELGLIKELASNLAFGIVSLRQRQEIEKSSITDGLTGIYNRRYFDQKFQEIVRTSKRNNQLVSFLMIDVDFFKQYNDNYGHARGDKVLQAVAATLDKATKRVNDYCFRLGGEEFGVLFLPNSKQNALLFAQSIKKNIDRLNIEHNYSSISSHITISVGLVSLEAKDIDNVQVMYQQTDKLLYEAKESGRDKIVAN